MGAPDPSYVQYAFISSLLGTTTKTWVATLPHMPDPYEVRF